MAEGIVTTLDATGSTVRVGAAVKGEADIMPFEALGSGEDPIPSLSFLQLSDQVSGITQAQWGEIVNRIWVVPNFIRPVNPPLLTNIPFSIWQTHPVANSLSSITGSGQLGLTLDISPPVAFGAYERQTVNLQVTANAPPEIFAIFDFNFDV